MKKILNFITFITLSISSYSQLTVVNNNAGIGTSTPENSQGWNRVLDVYGSDNSKVIVTTSSIHAGLWSHNSGYYGAPAGGMIGTKTDHPFSIITNQVARMTVLNNGNVGIGTTDPGPYRMYVQNGSYKLMAGGGTNGYGDHLLKLVSVAGQNFSVNSCNSINNQLATDIGINYSISGANSTSLFVINGSKKAPMIRFNAELGSITIYGENGCCTNGLRAPSFAVGIHVNSSGYVGIGKASATYQLDVNGAAYCTYGYWSGSDSKLKKNINKIDKSKLKSLFKLNAVSYQFKEPEIQAENADSTKNEAKTSKLDMDNFNRLQFGYLADEMELVYPNLVRTDSFGYKAVNYIALIPVIVEALKEQDSIIKIQNTQIEELKKLIKKNNSLRSAIISSPDTFLATGINTNGVKPSLSQNSPNPFNQITTIRYYLPSNTNAANLIIYNMNGNQLKSIPIDQNGAGSIIINGSEFSPGMYLYTLIADGKEIDTKRMILTE